jgi:phosphodiesterase/alkaline phosphatase D-like protein
VLWTRLAIDPLNGGGMPRRSVDVQWEVATDDKLSRVVRSGRVTASPEWAHSVHVEVTGLEPHRWYWYRFRVGDELSPVGRTRTFPQAQADVDRLRFAIASCQHYEIGLYTAYQHMAEEDLDLVLHLGDYIYENPGRDGLVRKHVGGELLTIDDYRNRYAQYRSDPYLRKTHASFPFVVVWDDHEVDNNYAGFYDEAGAPVEQFAVRRAAAHAAAALVSSKRRAASAISALHVWHAGQHLDARHAAVSDRSAVRRQRAAALCWHDGFTCNVAWPGAGKVVDESARSIAGTVELDRAADSNRAARSPARS